MRFPAVLIAMLLQLPAVGSAAESFAAGPESDGAWIARAQRHIALREYRASESAEGLQAPNRRHAIRTYFEPTGIRVIDRVAGGSPELFALRLVRLGRPAALAPVGPGVVTHDGPRIEIRRDSLVEWYVNDPSGLEQGFTLAQPPEGEGPLLLDLSLEGALASQSADSLRITTSTGRKLAYAQLTAFDATGAPLQAALSIQAGNRIQLRVDDANAVYPIAVDPLLSAAPDTLLESDQADANLGWSVAGAGDVNGDGYGDVIVGADLYDAGQSDEGAAFVFLGGPNGLADATPATAHAQLESDQAQARMGYAVAGVGDVDGDGFDDVVVGANLYDAGQVDEGAAFVFLGSAAGIPDATPATADAQLESNQASAHLGTSVGAAGDVNGDGYADVVVGADLYDAGQSDEGAAFVFLGSASGVASAGPAGAHARLEADQADAHLGSSVAGAGDVDGDGFADVIVGASLYDSGQTNEGAAFVFLGGSAGIADATPATALTQLEGGQGTAHLGFSISGAGDVNGDGYSDVILGAWFYDAGQNDEGAAFVFLGGPSGIPDASVATADAQLESNQAGARMGESVAGAGDVNGDGYADVIVGAYWYDSGQVDEGAAFIFLGGPSGIADGNPSTAHARLESDQATAEMGISVASAGDVNGDGFSDVIVGAWHYDAPLADEGAAFVFLGYANGILDGNPTTADAQLESDQTNAQMGISVASAGDVDGDGYGDVIVGAHFYTGGESEEGAAFVFLGSDAGLVGTTPATAHARLEADQAGAWMGVNVGGAGDVDGDGFSDVIVGARLYDAPLVDEGSAFVFRGGPAGIADGNPATADTRLEGDQAGAWMGYSVDSAGDVDGDGYGDVIVGAGRYDNGQSDEGAAFVFLGGPSGIADAGPATAHAGFESDQAGAFMGTSVSGAGDVDGDGFGDVIVGAYRYDAGQTDEGAVFVFYGNARPGREVGARQSRADLSSIPVQPWGRSGDFDAFVVGLTANHPDGSGRVKLEVEYCPPGVPFGDASCGSHTSASWILVAPPGAEASLSESITGLAPNTVYRWRARVLHAHSTVTQVGISAPAKPRHGPWRRLEAQWREGDIRTVPEPHASLMLLVGCAGLLALARRRSRHRW